MRKINYPFETDYEKEIFINEYFNKISFKIINSVEICKKIKEIDYAWNLKKLLTADFCELVEFSKKNNVENLDQFFKTGTDESGYLYSDLQRTIADFFISQNITIKTCFYCNIEYINSFKDQYSSVDEFINYAPNKLLKTLISEYAVNKISAKRKGGHISEKDFKSLFATNGNNILQKLKDKYNEDFYNEHFTLDHILPKSSKAFLSISLFNLVPCCHSCNSKFKLAKEFKINKDLEKIIPSSKDYFFDHFIEFRLKYVGINVEKEEDVEIMLTNVSKADNVDEFISIFKLHNRYNYHKNISYDMIKKRKIYSDSQIKAIANLLKRDEQSIKEDLFGKECFHSNNEPFEKYKQDIAEQLGII